MVNKNRNPLLVWGRDKKNDPRDDRFSSLMPNGDPRDGYVYPTPTLIMDSYITSYG